MKIKRYTAGDVRTAMKQLREELGPDAVILSNKKVDGGTEIVAAVDYDERAVIASARQQVPEADEQGIEHSLADLYRELSNLRGLLEGELSQLAWRETAGKSSSWSALYNRLAGLGLPKGLCEELLAALPVTADLESGWQNLLSRLADRLAVTGDRLLNEGGVVALVGSTGVGKSTTIAKLAARFALRHGRNQVALVTTDCYRIGGQEQLETFGKILGVPVVMATNEMDIRAALDALANRKLVLIDTAGMSQRDLRLSEQFSTLQNVGYDIQSYVVLSATSMPAVVNEVVSTFDKDQLAGAIVTKVDESTSLGPVLSALIKNRLPVSYIGNGQRVPEDIIPARADVLVNTAAEMAVVEQENDRELARRAG